MRLKLFRAPSVALAMAQIRAELGDDALILATRRVAGGVEVTAALEPAMALPVPAAAVPASDPAFEEQLRWHGVPQGVAARLDGRALEVSLAACVPFGSLDLSANSAPLLLAGPPGAGKTLTVARLATRLVMEGRTPMVISADGDRAGAAEQLAAFTRLLGLMLIVAPDPLTLARAIARRGEGAPVLIDTTGIDPFSPRAQGALASLATCAGAVTALVMPAGLDASEAADTAAAFKTGGATLLIATRLDVTRRIGGVLAAAGTGLRLAEAGVGPGAADGLATMTPALLAGRLAATPNRKAA